MANNLSNRGESASHFRCGTAFLIPLLGLLAACSTDVAGQAPEGAGNGASTSGASGNSGNGTGGGAGTSAGGVGASATGGGSGTSGGGTSGGGTAGTAGTGPVSDPGVRLRLLTKAEYLASLNSLFSTVTTELDLPNDLSSGGFVSIGASKVSVNSNAADKYEIASRAVVAEVFGSASRWQALVGCQPQANLSDTCVETFARTFGKRAFRRDLTDVELQQWVGVARAAATLAGSAAQGLSALTSGFLQSPNFLYRAETTTLDTTNNRLKYDGPSMAVRLSYFLTGGPPSAELLAAGESGQLDTAEGVRAAAAPMLSSSGLVPRLTSFFYEYTQADLVMVVEKSPDLFPTFTDSLRNSMREATQLFLERVVLAPGADVRSYFTSDQTFADAALASIIGVTPPASGFGQFTFPPQQNRAGIMGQPAVLAAHSKPDHSSPTARGLFMMQSFQCTIPNPPPGGVNTTLPVDPNSTTRTKLEAHRSNPMCYGCHASFDPMGLALEHFDAIGRYRDTENGLAIDTTGELEDGTPFDGGASLGAALGGSALVNECMLRNFYRHVNGREEDRYDQAQIDGMSASLSSHGYVFSELVADFVASDAFRSAPRVPVTQ